MKNSSTKFKVLSAAALFMFSLLGIFSLKHAVTIPTDYAIDQFFPKKHPLLTADFESKKLFQFSQASPYIVLLSLNEDEGAGWLTETRLKTMSNLGQDWSANPSVKSVISLANVPSASDIKDERGRDQLVVGTLLDLREHGFDLRTILKDPMFTPNLISKDGLHTAIFVTPPLELSQNEHSALLTQIEKSAAVAFPQARIQVGGPAAIRTQLIDLLSREIVIFIVLSLVGAMLVLLFMFKGIRVLPQMLFILIVSNTICLGVMKAMGISFNILSSTYPIIVTICALRIATHTLVRMGEASRRPWIERLAYLKSLIKELVYPHMLTAVATSAGFATLMISKVPLIADYGMVVAVGALVASVVTLILLPALYVWVKWPEPRPFLENSESFSYLLVRHSKWLTPVCALMTVAFIVGGSHLSWTAKLFDDLPAQHPARVSTELIARDLGGVALVDFVIGGADVNEPWKDPANIAKISQLSRGWRGDARIGSVVSLADFLGTGEGRAITPKQRTAIAELEFLYSMSGESPLKQYLSADGKWTRIALRLPDLPSNENRVLVDSILAQLRSEFPGMEVKPSGLAAIIPGIYEDISMELMWGFFDALFWIVLALAIMFRSLRWALIGVVPNLLPPAILLGFLALFNIPIKPGIALIFSISLGLAFCNTIYVLERLRFVLKSRSRDALLPIYSLMKKETMPCFVSGLSLFAGFAIFLFSVFPVNKMFGIFMLISILAGLLADIVWLPAILRRYPQLLLFKDGKMLTLKSQKWQRAAINAGNYLILLALGIFACRAAYAAGGDVQSILKSVEKKAAPPHERVLLKMTIQEADGSKKERALTILRRNDKEARSLIRLLEPADLKGLTLLTIAGKDAEEQHLYLPSDKKSRRILSSGKSGKFLDSEIAYEDLRLSTYKQFDNKIVQEDAKMVQIESKARPDSDSSYGRIVTWISEPDSRIEKVEYYDKAGKLLKRAEFKDYQKIDQKFWRARLVSVENLQTNRKTQLKVSKVSTKKISKDEVSLDALEE